MVFLINRQSRILHEVEYRDRVAMRLGWGDRLVALDEPHTPTPYQFFGEDHLAFAVARADRVEQL